VNEGILFVKSENILENKLSLHKKAFISETTFKSMKRSQLQKGDVLLNIVGASIGRSCVYDQNDPANINQAVCVIRPKKDLNSKYLAYLLNSQKYQSYFTKEKSGGARDNIDLYQVRNLPIEIPPLQTQQKLVQMMDQAYAIKKEKEQRAEELLDSINDFVLGELEIETEKFKVKNQKLNKIFALKISELKNNRFDPEYHLPKNKKLLQAVENGKFEVVEVKKSYKIQTEKVNNSNFDFINYIDLAGVNKDTGRVEKIRNLENNYPSRARQKVQTGDLLISSLAGSLKGIALVEQNLKNMIASTGFFVVNQTKNNLVYLVALLKTEIYQNMMIRETAGGIMSAISKNDLEKIKIPLPPLPIQQKIAEEVEKRRQEAFRLQAEAAEVLRVAKDEFEFEVLGKQD